MKITYLNAAGGGFGEEITLPEGSTLATLAAYKGFPLDTRAATHFVNYQSATAGQVLHEGDRVAVIIAKQSGGVPADNAGAVAGLLGGLVAIEKLTAVPGAIDALAKLGEALVANPNMINDLRAAAALGAVMARVGGQAAPAAPAAPIAPWASSAPVVPGVQAGAKFSMVLDDGTKQFPITVVPGARVLDLFNEYFRGSRPDDFFISLNGEIVTASTEVQAGNVLRIAPRANG